MPEDINKINKQLPQNIEAEQNILGIILFKNEEIDKVSEILSHNDFFDPLHGKIFQACEKLISRGQLANPITLKNLINSENEDETNSYLQQLVDGIGNFSDLVDFANSVHDCHLRREMILIGQKLIDNAYKSNIDFSAEEKIEFTETELYKLAENGTAFSGSRDFHEVISETITNIDNARKNEGKLSGLDTGLDNLNNKTGGLHASDLIIIAGRPSMGKTALATNISFNIASPIKKHFEPTAVIFFSLEMSSIQLATRILSERAQIDSEDLRRGQNLNEKSFNKISTASSEIYEAPFYIDETPAITIAQIANRSRRLKRKLNGKLGLIVIDYIQLIMSQSSKENRTIELSYITRGLKALAKELNVPVLALSQLSRAVEQREDKRPNLSDLRESGSIEQDADVVMFVYREEYYHEKKEPFKKSEESEDNFFERHQSWKTHGENIYGQAQVIIAKQRHGPTGDAKLSFTQKFTKFGDPVDNDHLPEGF